MSEPTPVTLTVSFDVDQTSSELNWEFSPVSRPASGRHSGAVFFAKGDNLLLNVVGYGGQASGFTTFQIVDCCIITRPLIIQIGDDNVQTLYAAPSPFLQAIGACYSFPLDFSATAVDATPIAPRRVTQHWKHSLNVIHAPGRWEMSFVITVRIMRTLGQVTETRVFSFDPESEVGNGTNTGTNG